MEDEVDPDAYDESEDDDDDDVEVEEVVGKDIPVHGGTSSSSIPAAEVPELSGPCLAPANEVIDLESQPSTTEPEHAEHATNQPVGPPVVKPVEPTPQDATTGALLCSGCLVSGLAVNITRI